MIQSYSSVIEAPTGKTESKTHANIGGVFKIITPRSSIVGVEINYDLLDIVVIKNSDGVTFLNETYQFENWRSIKIKKK